MTILSSPTRVVRPRLGYAYASWQEAMKDAVRDPAEAGFRVHAGTLRDQVCRGTRIAVAAGLTDRAARDEQPRADEKPHFHRLAVPGIDATGSPRPSPSRTKTG